MTVQSTNSSISYVGTGSTTTFAYPFKTYDQTWLKVYVDGTLKTLTTHYTVTGVGSDSGGNIVFGTAPANGAIVYIDRSGIPESQLTDYTANDKFPAETHERALDKLTMLIQRVFGFFTKSISIPNYETSNVTLPPKAQRAGQVLRFNSQGDVGVDSYLDTAPVGTFLQSGVGAIERSYLAKVREVVSVADFGAVGDGMTDDTAAFQKVSDYIMAQGGGKLIIPPGTYLVGGQTFAGAAGQGYAYTWKDIIHIHGCTKPVIIEGYGAILKVPDGLRFGSFDPVTGDVYTPSGLPFFDNNYAARQQPGIIYCHDNYSVSIYGFELDGNVLNSIIGGQFGDIGYQTYGFGLTLINNQMNHAEDMYIHHCPGDGIYIGASGIELNDTPNPTTLINIKSIYNCRHGLAWTGGHGLTAINSSFSHTAKDALPLQSPAAGVNVEPDAGTWCINGSFINCSIIDNVGWGFSSFSGPRTQDIKLIDCRIIGTTNYSVQILNPTISLQNCRIIGSINRIGVFTSPSDYWKGARFIDCYISDDQLDGYGGVTYADTAVIHGLSSNAAQFINCTVKATRLNASDCTFSEWIRCRFIFQAGVTEIGDAGLALSLANCNVFDCTFYDQISTSTTNGYYISTSNSNFYGQSRLLSPSGYLAINQAGGAGKTGNPYIVPQTTATMQEIRLTNNSTRNAETSRIFSTGVNPSTLSVPHRQGDIAYYLGATAGGYVGWVCTANGTPGTWKQFGVIEA